MKARNRKERLDFLIKKKGFGVVQNTLLFATDRDVKRYYEALYPIYKNKPDIKEEDVKCSRCGYDVEWISRCGCGSGRAVFSDDDWLDDINGNNELLKGDREFLDSLDK